MRQARERAGLSQEKLAERAGLSRQTIYRLELGQRNARLDWLIQVADACGVPLSELVREGEPRPPAP